ncbi:hypothetical protein SELMODRAFT_420856 [Selaginella moellendorffii]|uniref:Uncharacterized protein n=1 Tax=Selaginella moellendorffii TaxID=88036 RepID=D8SDC2_SELML|nr:hypothetical protein SELMODRAFT_420856 [Selaginella moellendorffii]
MVDLQARASISVHKGNLADLSCFTAILSMNGDASHKSNWWQFLQYLQSSSDQAFLGYMVSNFTGQSNLTAEIREKGGLLSTRNASLMEFHSVSKINKLGSMEITMWALGFLCLDEAPSCVKFTPVVLQAIPGSSPSKLGFFSLWEEQDGGILANSVASKVLTLENWSMSKESLSGMNLRSLDAKLDLCKGLELHPAHDRSNQELLGGLDLQSFDVKTAPEAAGFRLNERVTNITRPNRRLCLLGIDDNTTGSSLDSSLSFDLRTTTTLGWKTAVLCVSNSVLALGSYSAIITVTPSEIQRQERLRTWGLLADQVQASVYVRRMLKLLAELEPERHDADESNDERLDDLRAIEMGSVEQRQLEKRLAKMNAMPGTSMVTSVKSLARQRQSLTRRHSCTRQNA